MTPIRLFRVPHKAGLLAIAIPLGLMVLAFALFAQRFRCERRTDTRAGVHHLEEALSRYGADHPGQCPWSVRVLVDGHYLQRVPKDGWGTPLAFTCTSPFSTETPRIVSAGPDRRLGTQDDIYSDLE